MKVIKKLVISAIICCLMLLPLASTASAQDLANPDNWNALFEMIGVDINDPESIKAAIDKIQNGGIGAIGQLFGFDISEILGELQEYLFMFESETTTKPTEPPTTEPPATEPPIYVQPTYPQYTQPVQPTEPPSYEYATTAPSTTEPPSYEAIYPDTIYTEPYTTTPFNAVIDDDASQADSTINPLKTGLGVVLLVLSGVGVIVVIVALKRNRI